MGLLVSNLVITQKQSSRARQAGHFVSCDITGVSRRPPKIEREALLGFGRGSLNPSTHLRLTFDSPPLTLHSPTLRMSAGKSGVRGCE